VPPASSPDWAWIKPLVDAFGPAAAAFASVAIILFYILRRDSRAVQAALREDRTELIQVIRDVTRAIDQTRQSQEAFREGIDSFKEGLTTVVRAFEHRERRR
jgi:hypothetical protein